LQRSKLHDPTEIIMNLSILNRIDMSAVVLALVVLATPILSAQTAQLASPPAQVVTTGVGEAHITPDRAVISIGVQTRAGTAAQASADNAKRQRAILDTLRSLGVANDQLSTTNYSVFPEMASVSPQSPPKVTGYSVSNTVRVDVRKLDDISRFIDAALARGANTMSGLQFYASNTDSVRRSALAAAVAHARADAEVIARAGGGTLGPLLLLSSDEVPAPRPFEMSMTRAAIAVPTPIEAGQQTLSATVIGHWVFLPGR
jgi:uncharacterized protein YggE